MAQKAPQSPKNSDDIQKMKYTAKRPPLPEPMPVRYYETIEKSWRGHSIPEVPRPSED